MLTFYLPQVLQAGEGGNDIQQRLNVVVETVGPQSENMKVICKTESKIGLFWYKRQKHLHVLAKLTTKGEVYNKQHDSKCTSTCM